MHEPLGAALQVREHFLKYLDTAFRISNEDVAQQRRELFRRDGVFSADSLLEPLPKYTSATESLEDLMESEDGDNPFAVLPEAARRPAVRLLLSGLFPSRPDSLSATGRRSQYAPFEHQVEMLRRGLAGDSGIVTAGTGSGKTESFLLPVLSKIAAEACAWDEPDQSYRRNPWYLRPDGTPYVKRNERGHLALDIRGLPGTPTKKNPNRSPFRPQRTGERRPAAVRALILYPMNALVEDQMVRLRRALDSREAREVMDEEFNRNSIYFGRYTSATPDTGYDVHPDIAKLAEKAASDDRAAAKFQQARDRQDRRIRTVLQHFVDSTFQQNLVRLHADAKRNLQRLRTTLGSSPSSEEFFSALKQTGHCLASELEECYAHLVAPLDEEVRRHLQETNPPPPQTPTVPGHFDGEEPFLFPTVDGNEMTTRWDMQAHAPDILITNVSMLSAMLSREAESSIFESTREWLERDDSYFYLILDELHLQRGAAGTEVAFLLRLLLDRLGLTQSQDQRAKLRILASSASLPTSPDSEGKKSAQFLVDMFGGFGLRDSTDLADDELRRRWLKAIVPGKEIEPPSTAGTLPAEPFVRLANEAVARIDGERERPLPVPEPTGVADPLWQSVAEALNVPELISVSDLIGRVATAAGEWLSVACSQQHPAGEAASFRATPLADVARSLFPSASGPLAHVALRGLMLARGAAEALDVRVEAARSFRLHTFYRAPEGLFAAPEAVAGESTPKYHHLNIERLPHASVGDARSHVFELVYCEACGELFIGGMKGRLPQRSPLVAEIRALEGELEGLPDESVTTDFEDSSHRDYAVFWPRRGSSPKPNEDIPGTDPYEWIQAWLDPRTGSVRSPRGKLPTGAIEGWYLHRRPVRDRHRRDSDDSGTAVPYVCPACATSYKGRAAQWRLSPLRNFRAGFQRTTQLLAAETFNLQRASRLEDAKLVAFSDSRQDAARSALGIERRHHSDLRRVVLVAALQRRLMEQQDGQAWTLEQLTELKRALPNLPASLEANAETQIQQLEEALERVAHQLVPLDQVLEQHTSPEWRNSAVLPVIRQLALLGVHPSDDSGASPIVVQIDDSTREFAWVELFEHATERPLMWRRMPGTDDEYLLQAQQKLVRGAHRLLTEVIFSKTYFSLEEVGYGYPAIAPTALPPTRRTDEWASAVSALMRVFGDCYRYSPNPYESGEDDALQPVLSPDQAPARVRRFAEASWRDDWRERLGDALQDMSTAGHTGGGLRTERLALKLVDEDAPFVRCASCARVHLQTGTGCCTRCREPLPPVAESRSRVAELRQLNFLAARLGREHEAGSSAGFRLHCEELTGQTLDPGARQREFKGIVLPSWEEVDHSDDDTGTGGFALPEVDRLERAAREIDLLSVTTTMEVGIDIGALQSVLQANMPPQRFNYQQRVGRAGRRGQAFSMAVTLCRSKSHDLHYFRNTKAITGDPPPVPFLTKTMPQIPLRLLRKELLRRAYATLRASVRASDELFPTDWSTPDIHGEFLPRDEWLSGRWREAVVRAIDAVRDSGDSLVVALSEGSDLHIEVPTTDALVHAMDCAAELDRPGLGEALAEAGSLPMYGMPTRVRNLYRGLTRNHPREWQTTDRDLDIAIYEFAPGSVLVIDKQEHRCIGLTPDLAPPLPKKEAIPLLGDGDWRTETFLLIQCRECQAWRRLTGEEQGAPLACEACGKELDTDAPFHCVVPAAFRTDFRPGLGQEEASRGIRHRSINAEGRAIRFAEQRLSDGRRALDLYLDRESRTFRLNRGPILGDGEERGFGLTEGTHHWRGGRILRNQAVIKDGIRLSDGETLARPVFLAAPKVTSSLHLAPGVAQDGVAWHRVYSSGRLDDQERLGAAPMRARWLGVRAAGISATSILVSRVAQELDVDPDEFDVLEPRPMGSPPTMTLQFTDHLVNGAGLCEYLRQPEAEGEVARIANIVASIVDERASYPLTGFLDPGHVSACQTSCYLCLQRYGNQPYHALLDWKLGLAVLRGLIDPDYHFGLGEGELEEASTSHLPEVYAWKLETRGLLDEYGEFFGEVRATEGLTAVQFDKRGTPGPWMLMCHPLWEADLLSAHPRLQAAVRTVEDDFGTTPLLWDTFNIARRWNQVREWALLAT